MVKCLQTATEGLCISAANQAILLLLVSV